jgi:hypothetical protein
VIATFGAEVQFHIGRNFDVMLRCGNLWGGGGK